MPNNVVQLRLASMLALQDKINSEINPSWREASNPWYRAIWTESAELMDHVGWKWWKKSAPDIEQVRLEIIDIFHFGLSDLLQNAPTHEVVIENSLLIFSQLDVKEPESNEALLELIEEFTQRVLNSKRFDFPLFVKLSKACGLNTAEMHKRYAAKNVLNSFRQKNGYKQGAYIKIWNGREDNEILTEIASTIEVAPTEFAAELYRQLEKYYNTHIVE